MSNIYQVPFPNPKLLYYFSKLIFTVILWESIVFFILQMRNQRLSENKWLAPNWWIWDQNLVLPFASMRNIQRNWESSPRKKGDSGGYNLYIPNSTGMRKEISVTCKPDENVPFEPGWGLPEPCSFSAGKHCVTSKIDLTLLCQRAGLKVQATQ